MAPLHSDRSSWIWLGEGRSRCSTSASMPGRAHGHTSFFGLVVPFSPRAMRWWTAGRLEPWVARLPGRRAPWWRHITVASADVPTAAMEPGIWENLAAALTAQFAGHPGLTVTCADVTALPGSVALTMQAPGLTELTRRVIDIAAHVAGLEMSPGWGDPHLAIAYSNTDWDSPPLHDRLPAPVAEKMSLWLVSWNSLAPHQLPGCTVARGQPSPCARSRSSLPLWVLCPPQDRRLGRSKRRLPGSLNRTRRPGHRLRTRPTLALCK